MPQSVQGDLNPRIHHGKVAGCQATSWTHCSQFRRLESNQHPPVFSGTLDLRAAPENPPSPPAPLPEGEETGKLRGLDLNQHVRVQSPLSCR